MEGSGSKNGGPLALKFHQQPPEFPFQNVYFELKVFLQELDTGEPKCGGDVPLELRLWFDETPRTEAPRCIEVEGGEEQLYIRKETGCCEVRARITKCSMDLENRAFVICASAKQTGVVEDFSRSFKVMRHRLVIGDSQPWEDPWYKDEGGREKCIELHVKLVDSESEVVVDRKMPLRVQLLYAEKLNAVTNQDILKVFGPAEQQGGHATGEVVRLPGDAGVGGVMLEHGSADVKLRIEDVSKNHQGQNFRIRVAPDTLNSPTDCDVSHDLSRSVTVRSKRNKRRNNANNNHATAGGPRSLTGSSDVPRPILPPDGPAPRSALPGQIMRSMQSANDLKLLAAETANDQCRVALGAAMDWINTALETLRHLEWRVVGYEPYADGTNADPSKPLYVMTNPNDRIAQLIRAYDDSVAPHAHPNVVMAAPDSHGVTNDGTPSSKRPRTSDASESQTHRLSRPATRLSSAQLQQQQQQQRGRLAAASSSSGPSRPKFANGRVHDASDDDDDDDDDMIGGDAMPTSLERPTLSRARTSVNAVLDAIQGTTRSTGAAAATTPAFPDRIQSNMFDDDKTAGVGLPPPVQNNNVNNNATASTSGMATSAATPGAATNALAPPTMLRGVSSLYVGDSIPSSDRAPPAADGNDLAGIDLAEQAVRVVLAKRFKPPRTGAAALGFPAFDAEHRLVGLYREIQASNSTQIVFVPANSSEAGLQPGDSELATKAYEREVAKKSDCVHDLARHGSLERLKENVAIYHWSKEAFANDIDSSDLQKPSDKKKSTETNGRGGRVPAKADHHAPKTIAQLANAIKQ